MRRRSAQTSGDLVRTRWLSARTSHKILFVTKNIYHRSSRSLFTHYEFVYGYILTSRILRRMSTHSFISHGIIYFEPTSGLADADGSRRKLTEVLKIDKNNQNSMRYSRKYSKIIYILQEKTLCSDFWRHGTYKMARG